MKKKAPKTNYKKRALHLAKPTYARPADHQRQMLRNSLYAEHVAIQNAVYKRNEHDRITSQLGSALSDAARSELFAQKAKLFK